MESINISILKVFLLLIIFILGLVTYSCDKMPNKEAFTVQDDCPDILIQKDKELYLKNSKKAEVPGINPIKFNNLEEYIEYVEWQKSRGINCPILFLQHTYNAQGGSEYHIRPDPLNLQGGLLYETNERDSISGRDITDREMVQRALDEIQLDRLTFKGTSTEKSLLYDSHRDDTPFNANLFPGVDPHNQYIGLDVPLDNVYKSYKHKEKSPNAMDTNWGGIKYSREVVDGGAFDKRTRKGNTIT